jgi:hypothetical protein
MAWNPVLHSTEDNTKWSWLRAVEWVEWPLFLSQPVVPVLLYFYPWPWVLGVAAVTGFLWRLLVVPNFISPRLAGLGPKFVLLKYVTSPVVAFLLWRQNELWIAALALLWPLPGPFVLQLVISPLNALFAQSARGKASQIGIVQQRFMAALGYEVADG